ncbi:HAD family hydrolase [Asticcacaulis solisilvae]|uniref:HAD family hydrolase n=1 Tax=Asticcacaulis solisilvae TaxID=1217274 RepID=UPI003FD8F977
MDTPPLIDIAPDAEALVFDCDGTLADTFAAHFRCFRDVMRAFDYEFEAEFYAARLGLSRTLLLKSIQETHGVTLDDAEIARLTIEAFPGYVSAVTPIALTCDLARRHHGRLKMAVASAGTGRIVRAILDSIGVLPLFDAVVTIEDVNRGKPHPDIYLAAADRLKVAPARAHAFEDSDEGVEAARSAGMPVTDIRPYYRTDPTLW